MSRAALRCLPWLLATSPAFADGQSMDVELLDPAFSTGAIPGVDTPIIGNRGSMRVGTFAQYERDPLIFYKDGSVEGAVIAHRTSLASGVSYDWNPHLSVRMVVPAVYQQGSEVPDLEADGMGLRDLRLGARAGVQGPFAVGFRTDLRLPVGTREAWMGEAWPRLDMALLAEAQAGSIDALLDTGLTARRPLGYGDDFRLGSELFANLGARVHVWPERFALVGGLLLRRSTSGLGTGSTPTASSGQEAARPTEWLSGIQYSPRSAWSSRSRKNASRTRASSFVLDAGLGTGLDDGYGTTSLRVYGGLTWCRDTWASRHDAPRAVTRVEVPEDATLPEEVPVPEKEWKEGEIARVEEMGITIREPILFALGKERILPESKPVLDGVARLLNDHWQIAHLVVVGHASEEGSYAYNYDLSVLRAQAVFRALVEAGVHPDRLSYRGMGEVEPTVGNGLLADPANRRVEFRIVQLLGPVEEPEALSPEVVLPWNGEVREQPPQGQLLIGTPEVPGAPVESEPVDLLRGYLQEDREETPEEGEEDP